MDFNFAGFDNLISGLEGAGRRIARRAGVKSSSSSMGRAVEDYMTRTEAAATPKAGFGKYVNRNSAVGELHGALSSAFGGTVGAQIGAGVAIGLGGLAAGSLMSNEMASHPGAAPIIGLGGAALGAAAVIDPTALSGLIRSSGKIGQSIAPGVLKVS